MVKKEEKKKKGDDGVIFDENEMKRTEMSLFVFLLSLKELSF